MTARRQLFAMLLVVALALAGMNFIVARLSANVPARLLIASLPQASRASVLVLGNSLMASGFDPEAFAARSAELGTPQTAFNAALGATSPAEHLAIAHRAVVKGGETRTLIYGFFDFMLTDSTATDLAEIRGNRAVILHLDPALAARHLARSPWEGAILRATAHLPLYVERGNLWGRTEKLRRTIGAWGLPPDAVNRWGRVEDFAALETQSAAAFRRHCTEAVEQRTPITPALAELFSFAAANDLRIGVVEAPMTSHHRAGTYDSEEWRRYREHVRNQLQRYPAELIAGGDWSPDHKFVDALHLGHEGAAEFSSRLALSLQRNPSRTPASPK